MLKSTDELDWQSELDYANRVFAELVGEQRYADITREEAKRFRQSQPAQEAVSVEKSVGILGTATADKEKPSRCSGASCSVNE